MSVRGPRWPGIAGGLCGAVGVALSAYAAHAAAGATRERLYTAAAMALVHGLALVAYAPTAPAPAAGRLARLAMLAGVLLFSGSLVGAHFFGWPTRLAPVGGSLLILAWLLVAVDRGRG